MKLTVRVTYATGRKAGWEQSYDCAGLEETLRLEREYAEFQRVHPDATVEFTYAEGNGEK